MYNSYVLLAIDSINAKTLEKPHQKLQESIKHSYDINKNQLTDESQQQEYQFINPEMDVQWFERISKNSKQSIMKRKRRASVYSTLGIYII